MTSFFGSSYFLFSEWLLLDELRLVGRSRSVNCFYIGWTSSFGGGGDIAKSVALLRLFAGLGPDKIFMPTFCNDGRLRRSFTGVTMLTIPLISYIFRCWAAYLAACRCGACKWTSCLLGSLTPAPTPTPTPRDPRRKAFCGWFYFLILLLMIIFPPFRPKVP